MKNIIKFLENSIQTAQRCTEISNDYLKGYVDAMNETKHFIKKNGGKNTFRGKSTPKPINEVRNMAKAKSTPFANYISFQLNDNELMTLLFVIGLDDEKDIKKALQRVTPRVRFGYILYQMETK